MIPNAGAQDSPQKKRRRPALACEQCRRRKIRCDRNSPCNHCVKANIPSCTYAPTHVPASRVKKTSSALSSAAGAHVNHPLRPAQPSSITPDNVDDEQTESPPQPFASSSKPSVTGSLPSVPSSVAGSSSVTSNVDWLVSRVHQLEEKLASVLHIGDSQDLRPPALARHNHSLANKGTVSKSRYFSQGHWMNGVDLFTLEFDLIDRARLEQSDIYHLMLKCKALARKIKEHRFKPIASDSLGRRIPSRDVADKLVDAYLRTFEGVIRIIHVPTFRADYERYWQSPDAANPAFVMQMQLCMAVGATMYDDKFSLRSLATQWVYEAQLWLMMPPEKSRMTIAGFQVNCLLTLAKSACGVGQDLTWVMAGNLIRKAMYMGLHRDPKHLAKMSTYRAEMRRRLWAAALELNLQASFDAGASPLISTADYDAQPPANIDDSQLSDETDSDMPHDRGSEAPTQCSVQLALLKSLPLRVNLLKYINDFQSTESYDETLRLNSELTKAARALAQTLSTLASRSTAGISPVVTPFHISMAEMFVYRCFHSLHQPVIMQSLNNPKFYFSRKMYLDSALKLSHIWGFIEPGLSPQAGQDAPPQGNSVDDDSDFKRLIVTGAGMFRNVAIQALFMIANELIHYRNDNTLGMSLGYLPASVGSHNLKACLQAALAWSISRMYAGETNFKGHCFMAACVGHVEGLEAGANHEGIETSILTSIRASVQRCSDALTEMSQREGVAESQLRDIDEQAGTGAQEEGLEDVMLTDWMGDWVWDDMEGLAWQQWPQQEPFGAMQGSPGANQF